MAIKYMGRSVTIVRKVKVSVGDFTENVDIGRTGIVEGFGQSGDPRIKYIDDGSVMEIPPQAVEKLDSITTQIAAGDRVKDQSGRYGVVVGMGSTGKPVFRYLDGAEAIISGQRHASSEKSRSPSAITQRIF